MECVDEDLVLHPRVVPESPNQLRTSNKK